MVIKMKIGSKLVFIGILSLLVGSAFASPLLVSELEIGEIKPFPKPPPNFPTSDITSEVLYANFSINPNSEQDKYTDISYFVVLNITNNSDEYANVTLIQFDAEIPNYTYTIKDSAKSIAKLIRGWNAEGAYVDGVWYNLTWVPNKEGFDVQYETDAEGYWMEGVQIKEKYVNYEFVYTHMNMNGTWVDVTGRIDVTRPPDLPPTKPVTDGTIFAEIKFLQREREDFGIPMMQQPTGTPEEFNECWAPHQSRLIVVTDARSLLSRYYEPTKLEQLKTGKIWFNTSVRSWVTVNNWTSTALAEDTMHVQLELADDCYLYGSLPEDQMFVMDSFGVEVFIEPRN